MPTSPCPRGSQLHRVWIPRRESNVEPSNSIWWGCNDIQNRQHGYLMFRFDSRHTVALYALPSVTRQPDTLGAMMGRACRTHGRRGKHLDKFPGYRLASQIALNKQAVCSSDTLVSTYQTRWRHTPQDHNMNFHRRVYAPQVRVVACRSSPRQNYCASRCTQRRSTAPCNPSPTQIAHFRRLKLRSSGDNRPHHHGVPSVRAAQHRNSEGRVSRPE